MLQKYVDYDYDAFNRLWKVLYPGDGSHYEEYLYDGNDNLTNSATPAAMSPSISTTPWTGWRAKFGPAPSPPAWTMTPRTT